MSKNVHVENQPREHIRKVIVANSLAKKYGAEVGLLWTQKSRKIPSPSDNPPTEIGEFTWRKGQPEVSCMVDDNFNRQRLVTVIEDSNDAVLLVDVKGNIVEWNRKAEALYGYSAEEATQMTVFDLVPPNRLQETRQLLYDVGAGVLVKPFETKRIAWDGTILDICLKVTRLVKDGNISAIVATERDITDHNRLFKSLRELPGRIIMAQEKERSRISQALHSEFGQSLISLKLFAAISASKISANDLQLKQVFEQIKSQLDQIINDARHLAHELSPPGLRYVGLVPAIKALVESTMLNQSLKISFFHNNIGDASFKENDIIIYRILQEALQNISKHAQATQVRVEAVVSNSIFTLEIKDNGLGFDTKQVTTRKGLGLALMKEQATIMMGLFRLKSRIGKGTSIKIAIPVKEKGLP